MSDSPSRTARSNTGRATTDGRVARRELTREKVLEAAATLFAARGYAATTIDDVAAAAEVSKGTVFYGFSSKEELFAATLDRGAHAVITLLNQARQGRRGWEALSNQALAVLSAVDRRPDLGRLLVNELLGLAPVSRPDLAQTRAALTAPLVATLTELQAEAARPDLASGTDGLAVALLGALVFAALDRIGYTPDRPLADVHARLMLSLDGLRPRGWKAGID